MIAEINNIIDTIRINIFDYDLKEMFMNVEKLTIKMENYDKIKTLSKEKSEDFNFILNNINISMENRDYILVSDILNYELKYFINNL